jgi:cation diffusion facilitator CzcD-associated flavoprotein CzcO
MSATDIAIIGAGPYGLSLAAHLAERGVSFRIFGKPMESWLAQMPRGMHLKSEGFASSLYDPKGLLTLGKYCGKQDLPYGDIGLPVPLSLFCEYGLAFQRRMVPSLDRRMVTALHPCAEGFALQLDDGETLSARRVVVAVGISHFAQMPTCLAGAPAASVSHSSEHADVSRYKDKDILVIGAGASAVDLSVLLHEAGAKVRLATRRKELEVHTRMQLPRPLSDRLSAPMTGIGPSWRSWFFSHAAPVFHRFPEARRLKWVRTHLGPAAGWFMAERLRAVPVLTGKTLMGIEESAGKTVALFKNHDGSFDRLLTCGSA